MAISQDCSEFQENLGEFETFYRRFPRRFTPRNDKAEALCHTEDTPMFSPCLPSETSGWAAFSPARFAKTKCTARQAGRSACQKVPSGLLPSCLQNCKTFCSTVLQFCRCGGLLNAKGHPDGFLSLFSSLRNLRLDWFFDTQTQKRNVPPGKPDGTFRRKERKREKKRKSMKKRGGAIYGRHRIRAGDCPARTAPAHWPMLLALRPAPHRPCCQTRWAGGTSCRSARW